MAVDFIGIIHKNDHIPHKDVKLTWGNQDGQVYVFLILEN